MNKILILGLLAAVACSQPSEQSIVEQSDDRITLTDEQIQFNRIVVGKLSLSPVRHKIQATGVLDVPPDNVSELAVPIHAYITKLNVLPGDKVTKGQVLATLKHPDIAVVQSEYIKAMQELVFAKKDLARKEELVNTNAVSQRDYQLVSSQVQALEAKVSGLEQEIYRLGLDPAGVKESTISQSITIRAPKAGMVTAVNAKNGSFVEPGSPIVTVVNREHLHVELQIFQKDLPKVKKGMKVEMTIPGYDEVYTGSVFLINHQLDAQSLSTNVHVHPDNNFPELNINAVVFGEIIYQVDSLPGLPTTELIHEGNAYFLFAKSNDSYEKVQVEAGYDDGEHISIVGPQSLFNQEVVLSGNYFLNGI